MTFRPREARPRRDAGTKAVRRANSKVSGCVMFSAAEASFSSAVAELRGEFGRDLEVEQLGPDLGVLTSDRPNVKDVAEACTRTPLLYVRHLSVGAARMDLAEAQEIDAVARMIRPVVASGIFGQEFALQVWSSGNPKVGYRASELHGHIVADLSASGYEVARAGKPQILSCCISDGGIVVGGNQRRYCLSDWPGGRVHLSRDAAQISRAEFKLEELFKIVDVRLPENGLALDLGGSPGGWTRILRGAGMRVCVVDPGDVDAALAADRRVRHERTTAGEFFRHNRAMFDLIVNDMRMDPTLSCRMMNTAARDLRRGALAIMTLKIGPRGRDQGISKCLQILRAAYTVEFARQLYHNRNEVTVVMRRI